MTTVMISHNLIYIKKTTSSYIEMQIDATDLSSDYRRDKIRCDPTITKHSNSNSFELYI